MHTGDMTRSKAKILDKRILVLQGGRGNEREVSLRSAGQVAGALQSLGTAYSLVIRLRRILLLTNSHRAVMW